MSASGPGGPTRRPAPIRLHAGPLTAIFEPHTGWLRHLCLGGSELIRAVYGAVRDRHWRTITPRIQALDTVVRERTFDIQFLNRCEEGDVHFAWQAHVRGAAEGTCSFRFDGEAESSFLRNRIGLCLLHPLEGCAGQPCTIEHIDGSRTEAAFPDLVAPHQPFLSIRGMSWATAGGRVTVTFDGEIFETEDQRNWGDASFKTYGTPLALPLPAQVSRGDRVRQRIDIVVEPTRAIVAVAEGRVTDLQPAGDPRPRPPVGFVAPPPVNPLTPGQLQTLRHLAPGHLRVDVDPAGDQGLREALADAARTASSLGARLQVAATLRDDPAEASLQRVADAVRDAGVPIELLLVLGREAPVNASTLRRALDAYAGTGSEPRMAVGTNRYFAELNRNRPADDGRDVRAFSLNPQVHAVDDVSVMENLEALPWIARTAHAFSPAGIAISPITLRPRFNPDVPVRVLPGGVPEHVDPRQRTLFGAAWTLGSLALTLPLDGVDSLTYYELTGPGGLMEGDHVFPLYHVLADLSGTRTVQTLASTVPSRVLGLRLGGEQGTRVLVANLSDHAAHVRVPVSGATCRVRLLDDRGLRQATAAPEVFRASGEERQASGGRIGLELPPYATARIDWT